MARLAANVGGGGVGVHVLHARAPPQVPLWLGRLAGRRRWDAQPEGAEAASWWVSSGRRRAHLLNRGKDGRTRSCRRMVATSVAAAHPAGRAGGRRGGSGKRAGHTRQVWSESRFTSQRGCRRIPRSDLEEREPDDFEDREGCGAGGKWEPRNLRLTRAGAQARAPRYRKLFFVLSRGRGAWHRRGCGRRLEWAQAKARERSGDGHLWRPVVVSWALRCVQRGRAGGRAATSAR